jgi:hypothetical protein
MIEAASWAEEFLTNHRFNSLAYDLQTDKHISSRGFT